MSDEMKGGLFGGDGNSWRERWRDRQREAEEVERRRMDEEAPEAETTEERNRAAWERYHRENPEVYETFCAMADRVIASGRTHYSARTIIEVIRWESTFGTTTKQEGGFRVANAHSRFYADLWQDEHPEHPGFFRVGARPSQARAYRGRRPA